MGVVDFVGRGKPSNPPAAISPSRSVEDRQALFVRAL